MSQPKTQLSRYGLSSSENSPRCSIVRYEIHLFESSTYGSTIASVGHASMHAVHEPQKSAIGSSYSNSRSTMISPRNIHEPYSFEMTLVCFPSHPTPARTAHALSMTGPVST